ncbi:Calpain-5 [Halotydeus destructor]|nr:Calpain-5 [Halotydeus destructor]
MTLRKEKRFKKQSYKKLLKESIETGVPFNDGEFRSSDESVFTTTGYKSSLSVGKIIWKRPTEISEDPHLMFTEKLGPLAEIEFVGRGPNDWLIAACCAIAQSKQLVYQILSKDQYHFLHGIFKVRFSVFGNWTKVVIDDKLPAFDGKAVFSASNKDLYWVPLIEKAYAKLHGSYEAMSHSGAVGSALADFTGAPVETIAIELGDDEKHLFRLIAEELEKHSIICVKTRDTESVISGIQRGRHYLINSVRKPSAGSFKKTLREINASLKLVSTYYDDFAERNNKTGKAQEIWFNIENIVKCFESVTICHLKISSHRSSSTCLGDFSSQYCFDLKNGDEEIVLQVSQESVADPVELSYKIYRVEVNRQYKVHNLEEEEECFSFDSNSKLRYIFKRIKLDAGRYVVIPYSSAVNNGKIMLRLFAAKASALRKLTQDMPRNMVPFFAPKYPKYVSRVAVKQVTGLDKQDRFGSANPYVVIHCGKQCAKSHSVHDSLSPDFQNFSAIYYHEKFVPILVEVWHSSILVDSLIGRVEVIPKVNLNDEKEVLELDLCDKKGNKVSGKLQLTVQTSEDLRIF